MTGGATGAIETMRAGYDAFARGDIPRVLAELDEGIVWVDPEGFPWPGGHAAHDEVLAHFFTAGQVLGPRGGWCPTGQYADTALLRDILAGG